MSGVSFHWDPRKARSNQQKHGISFADAVAVFEDDLAVTIPDDYPYEERFVTIGSDFLERVLVVVFVWRGDEIRLISARKATSNEREHYVTQ